MVNERRGLVWAIDESIVGLLRHLPPYGTEWPAEERERWLEAFRAVIDVVYPDSPVQVDGEEQRQPGTE